VRVEAWHEANEGVVKINSSKIMEGWVAHSEDKRRKKTQNNFFMFALRGFSRPRFLYFYHPLC
jgi:hypothetical protein